MHSSYTLGLWDWCSCSPKLTSCWPVSRSAQAGHTSLALLGPLIAPFPTMLLVESLNYSQKCWGSSGRQKAKREKFKRHKTTLHSSVPVLRCLWEKPSSVLRPDMLRDRSQVTNPGFLGCHFSPSPMFSAHRLVETLSS